MWPFHKNVVRSRKSGERITDDECNLIRKKKVALCPDCGSKLLAGPQGGCAINSMCEKCGSEFNLTFFFNTIIGERISDPGPRDPGDRRTLYHEAFEWC